MSEAVRLLTVKQFEQFDLQFDDELQQIITTALEVCDNSIALITLLDEETHRIKVHQGLDEQGIPHIISFCSHIEHDNLMIVDDTHLDDRFINAPQVTGGPKIRFYAGITLITSDGYRIGTLGIADQKPNTLDKRQQSTLKLLAKQVTNTLELKLSKQLLEQSKKEAEKQKQTIINAEIRLRSFFENSSNLYVLLGKSGEVLDYNKAAYNFIRKIHSTKLTRGDIFIKYLEPRFVSIFIEKYHAALEGIKCTGGGKTDYGEGEVWWESSFEPACDNEKEVIGVSYVIRDVTERKVYEQKIIAQNQSLINIAHIQSHEYRGPLTSIMGLMILIKEENYQPPVEYLQLLEIAIDKLDQKMQEIISHVNSHDVYNNDTLKLS